MIESCRCGYTHDARTSCGTGWPNSDLKKKQEVVSDGFLFVTRLEVPGGWIYNSFDKGQGIGASVFVPYPRTAWWSK